MLSPSVPGVCWGISDRHPAICPAPHPQCVGESLGGKGQQVGDRAMSPRVPAPHLSSPLGSSRKHLAAGRRGLRVLEEMREAPGAERQASLGSQRSPE